MNENQELFIDESMIKNISDYNLIKDEILIVGYQKINRVQKDAINL